MSKYGSFTLTIGHPIQLQGFSDGAAVSWSQDEEALRQIKSEIEGLFDVFSDEVYPYEDFYQYVESGFIQGITEAQTMNDASANWAGLKVIALLSAPYRLDLDQDEGEILASYADRFTNHPLGLNFLSQAGIPVDRNQKTQVASAHKQSSSTPESKNK